MLSPNEASKHFPVSKTSILRDIKEGRLSATRNDRGHYKIDPAELARVYGAGSGGAHHGSNRGAPRFEPNGADGATEEALKLALVEKERDAAQQLAEERARTITDLRDRLDKEGEERRKLTAMITDQREMKEPQSAGRVWMVVAAALPVAAAIVWGVTQLP